MFCLARPKQPHATDTKDGRVAGSERDPKETLEGGGLFPKLTQIPSAEKATPCLFCICLCVKGGGEGIIMRLGLCFIRGGGWQGM